MNYIVGILKEKKLVKESNTWKLFELLIEADGKEEKHLCFSSLGTKEGSKSMKLAELCIGETYSFGIVTNDKGDNIAFVQKPKDKTTNQQTQTTSKKFNSSGEVTKVEINKNADAYKDFNIEYVKEMRKQKREINARHYFGCFLWTFKIDFSMQELLEWLNNEFETKVKQEAELQSQSDEISL